MEFTWHADDLPGALALPLWNRMAGTADLRLGHIGIVHLHFLKQVLAIKSSLDALLTPSVCKRGACTIGLWLG